MGFPYTLPHSPKVTIMDSYRWGCAEFRAAETGIFITCSRGRRDLFLKILEQVRQKYNCAVFGYVVMPEHFHLLVTEPRIKTLSVMMQVLKQRVSRQCRRRRGHRHRWNLKR